MEVRQNKEVACNEIINSYISVIMSWQVLSQDFLLELNVNIRDVFSPQGTTELRKNVVSSLLSGDLGSSFELFLSLCSYTGD